MPTRLLSYTEITNIERATTKSKQLLLQDSRRDAGKNVFLSHSSKDDALIPGIISFLESHGGTVYADDYDTSLPNPPSVTTAVAIKNQIAKLSRLVVLATSNTHTSRWIPWELGLADGIRGIPPNAILPATEEGTQPPWLSQEYFRLYPLILNIEGQWRVTDPRSQTNWSLRHWLTSTQLR